MKFKIGDIIAVIYFAAFVCLVFFFPLDYGAHGKADLSNLEFSGKIAGLCAADCTHCGKCADTLKRVLKRAPAQAD